MSSAFTEISTQDDKAVEFKANAGQFNVDEALGIVECFVAGIGNKDSVGDVCLPGAFLGSLKRRKPRVVWGHNWNEPIGKVLDIYEVGPNDPRLPSKMRAAGIGGLYARVQFNLKSERGKEAFHSVVFFGEEQEWSIGYKTLDAIFDPSQQANLLKEVELYEVSPVLHGANQLTGTISIKSDKPLKDPKGGLTAAGRAHFKRTQGANLKPGVKGPADTPEKMRRKGSFLTRFYTNPSGPLVDENGQPTRLALAAAAWGEPVPKTQADAAKLAAKGRRMLERYGKNKTKADPANGEKSCPVATQDIGINIKNRQNAIETAAYGPLNPEEPNQDFWKKKADRWDVTEDSAKKQRCGNCIMFVRTPRMLDCIEKALGNEEGNVAWDIIEAGDIGYCEAFDFKCHAARTCDAWVVGGPTVTESPGKPVQIKSKNAMMYESPDMASNTTMGRVAELAKALSERFSAPVSMRTADRDMAIFDINNGGARVTMRVTYYFDGENFMFGEPQQVRAETVYLPINSPTGAVAGHAFNEQEDEDDDIDEFEYAHNFREMLSDISQKPHDDCGCGCNGAGTCGTTPKPMQWGAFKERTPGAHLFIRAIGQEKSDAMEIIQTVCDYHGLEMKDLEDGIAIPFIDEMSNEGYEAIMTIAENMSDSFDAKGVGGKLRRIGNAAGSAMDRFDPNAWDADGDRVVQEGTRFARPAGPKVRDAMHREEIDPKTRLPLPSNRPGKYSGGPYRPDKDRGTFELLGSMRNGQSRRRADSPQNMPKIKPVEVPEPAEVPLPQPKPNEVPTPSRPQPAVPERPAPVGRRISGSMGQGSPRAAYASAAQFDVRRSSVAQNMTWSPEDGGTVTVGYKNGKTRKFTNIDYERAKKAGNPDNNIDDFIRELEGKPSANSNIYNLNRENNKLRGSMSPGKRLDKIINAGDGDSASDAWDEVSDGFDKSLDEMKLDEMNDHLDELEKQFKDYAASINSEINDELVDRLTWQDEDGVIKHLMRWQDMNKREAQKEAEKLQEMWDTANQVENAYHYMKTELEKRIKEIEKEDWRD